jgi:CubicO group peptidase (beta-lactamase class C family)
MIAEPLLPRIEPERVGLSSARLRRIDTLMQAFVDRGVISGAVTLLARKGQVAHLAAYGQMDLESARPMRTDTLFRLASMTKPVISVAILMLLEEGKLLLQEPVSNYLPTFRNLHVAVPNQPVPNWAITDLAAGDYHLEPAQREITIRDLLTHTSGLGSATQGPCATETLALAESIRSGDTLSQVIPKLGTVPLSFQPGAAWEYSPAFGFDTLARIVEIVSGLEIDHFLTERLFEPLGMANTTFSVPPDRLSDLATPYERSPQGGLHAGQPVRMLSLSTDPENRYFSGGGGLVGTAEDYAAFAVMLARGGQNTHGERLLSHKTVELMASNHIGDLPLVLGLTDHRGYRFGLGVRVLENPAEGSSLASRGTFGWSGAFGTNSFIDPVEQLVGIMLIQRLPDPTDHLLRSLWLRYQMTAYQAIDD